LKEIKVLIKGFFYVPKKKGNKDDDFAIARVDERCLWLALQY
jgi:hypothetical protein